MQTISTQINFLKKYSKLSKYILAVVVFGLGSVSLLSSPISPVNAATTVGVSNTTIVPQGLVGYWTFDGKNMTNATATDISGSGLNGTLKNMTTAGSAIPGKMGQALKFNGTSNYINLGSSAVDNSVYSISLWVYNYGSTTGQVFMRGNGTSYCFYNPSIYIGNGTISVAETGCSGGGTIGSKALTKGWHHIVITRNGQNAIFYVDGVVVATDNSNNGGNPTQGVLIFGAAPTNPSGSTVTNYFDGALDDVRIYNRAITSSEVQTLYRAGGGVLTTATPSTSNAVSLNSGLAGYWTFDGKNMTNATATDMSGNGNNGTLTNMSKLSNAVVGKIGQALKFVGGTNTFVSVKDSNSLDTTSDLTISTWVKANSWTGESIYNYSTLVKKDQNYILRADSVTISGCGATTQLKLLWFNGSYIDSYCVALPTVGMWHHIVATVQGGTTKKMYIDGVLQSGSYHPNVTTLARNLTVNLSIGDHQSSGGEGFDGQLDEVRVYTRALSAQEVQSLYKLGQTLTSVSPTNNNGTGINSGLIGYWPFDGKYMTNTTVLDASGNGLTGTLTNMTRNGSAVIGKIGQGLKFTGAGQYISLGTPASLDLRSAHSISVWVKTNVLNTTQTIFAAGTQGCCGTENLFSLNYNGGGGTYRPQYAHSAFTSLDAAPPDLKTNTWYHIVATWDGSATQKIYINGILSNSGALTGIGSFGNIANIGATDGGATSFNGTMDDLRVYSRELSTSDVKALYKLGN